MGKPPRKELTAYVEEATYQNVVKLAEKKGISRSAVVNDLLKAQLRYRQYREYVMKGHRQRQSPFTAAAFGDDKG